MSNNSAYCITRIILPLLLPKKNQNKWRNKQTNVKGKVLKLILKLFSRNGCNWNRIILCKFLLLTPIQDYMCIHVRKTAPNTKLLMGKSRGNGKKSFATQLNHWFEQNTFNFCLKKKLDTDLICHGHVKRDHPALFWGLDHTNAFSIENA